MIPIDVKQRIEKKKYNQFWYIVLYSKVRVMVQVCLIIGFPRYLKCSIQGTNN